MAGEPLTLEAMVEAGDRTVSSISILHRIIGESSYNEVNMSAAGGGLCPGRM